MAYDDDIRIPRIPWGKIVLIFFGVVIVGMAVDWMATGNSFFMYKFFAPRQADVQREVYTHTRSYRQGSVQRLDTLCTQVHDADADHKVMLNSVIEQEFADWNVVDVPDYLRGCLADARAKK